jgi:hypothetical protein
MYLYAGKVQGIQRYIFETNRLKEIIGASGIIEHICSPSFLELDNYAAGGNVPQLLVSAAGTIRVLFYDKGSAEQFTRSFPYRVHAAAKGVSFIQAIVPVKDSFEAAFRELENRLRIQKNKSSMSLVDIPVMAAVRARRTGRPAVSWDHEEALDISQNEKHQKLNSWGNELAQKLVAADQVDKIPVEMEHISGGESNKSWIAVIHIDGNQLGQTIIDLSRAFNQQAAAGGPSWTEFYTEFSHAISCATSSAASAAMKTIEPNRGGFIPVRPIILGGDDFTAIVSGKSALEFTRKYLEAFEKDSIVQLRKLKDSYPAYRNRIPAMITACAGIAFVKDSFPLHYAVELADELCKEAKSRIKAPQVGVHSGLMFHKVYSSIAKSYEDIVGLELVVGERFRYDVGPYLLRQDPERPDYFYTIDNLFKWKSILSQPEFPLSKLRGWMNTLESSEPRAKQDLRRLISELENKEKTHYSVALGLPEVLADFEAPTLETQNAIKDPRLTLHLHDAIAITTL